MKTNILKNKFNDYWRDIDKNILLSFIILFLLGLFFSFASTSSLAGERFEKDYYFFFTKHLVFVIFSLFIMFFISALDLNFLNKFVLPAFIILYFCLILVHLIGIEVKGSKRWLNLYLFRFQPIEFMKPFFILITAKILTSENFKSLKVSYFLSFLVLFSILILLVNQPDIGQSVLLFACWMAIIFISGVNIFYILSFFAASILSLTALLITFPDKFGYITNRLTSFLDPSKGDSFQSQRALDAIRQGGLKGQGMGEGILKDNVPEAHTDYIIAVITEEFGSIISIFLIFIFLYISLRIIKKTISELDKNLRVALCGLASLLIFQAFIHIGVNTSLLPTTGMTLPFLSYGGSSLFGSSILAGLILNYTKNRVIHE
tara:strand:- start:1722 stop:2846 length:1125 start_codon:yes stop_codon:yes gene_type:complete